jgi:hypothetical protein
VTNLNIRTPRYQEAPVSCPVPKHRIASLSPYAGGGSRDLRGRAAGATAL